MNLLSYRVLSPMQSSNTLKLSREVLHVAVVLNLVLFAKVKEFCVGSDLMKLQLGTINRLRNACLYTVILAILLPAQSGLSPPILCQVSPQPPTPDPNHLVIDNSKLFHLCKQY